MCGIAAVFGAVDASIVDKMLEDVAHRGPDDRATYELHGRVALGI